MNTVIKHSRRGYRYILALLLLLCVWPFKTIHAQIFNKDAQTSASANQQPFSNNEENYQITIDAQEPGIKDTLLFHLGDGTYTVNAFDNLIGNDYGKRDKVIFGKDITRDMIHFNQEDENLIVMVGNQDDKIIFTNYFKHSDYQTFNRFEFTDGVAWADIRDQIFPDEAMTLTGGAGNDTLIGGTGNDLITDNVGYNYLDGGAGNDTITGRGELTGGTGNDSIINRVGGSANDIIHFNLGDGKDTIDSADQYADQDRYKDKIIFGEDVTPEMISFRREGNALIVVVGSQGDEMNFINFFKGEGSSGMAGQSYRQFEFADGTKWEDIRTLKLTQYYPDNYNTIIGTPWNDAIYAGSGNDNITDYAGYNYLDGGAGNDTITGRGELTGGTGNDSIINRVGGSANDIIHFNLGDGKDTIDSADQYADQDRYKDKIIFGEDVTPEMISFRREGNALIVVVGSQGDEMNFINFFKGEGSSGMAGQSYRQFEFADGTKWEDIRTLKLTQYYPDNYNTIIGTPWNDAIYAGSGNDNITDYAGYNYLDGGAGNDTITGRGELTGGTGNDSIINRVGGSANDIIHFNLGDGKDTIDSADQYADQDRYKDKIIFGEDVTPEMISFRREGNALIVVVGSQGDEMNFINFFKGEGSSGMAGQSYRQFEFADGTKWEDIRTLKLTQYYPDNYNTIIGTPWNDAIYAGSGNDNITDYAGYNYLDGGAGNDTITGRGELTGGTGNDSIINRVGGSANDIIHFNLGDGKDTIDSADQYADQDRYKDKIIFGEDVTPEMISFRREGNALIVVVGSQGDEMNFINFFKGEGSSGMAGQSYRQFEFADGTKWEDIRTLKLTQYYPDNYNTIIGTPWNDAISGGSGDDSITDYAGYNYLDGGAGDDTITGRGEFKGGIGNDHIINRINGSTDDIIYFNLGDGKDTIDSYDYYADQDRYKDKIIFGEDVTPEMISFRREGNSLVVMVGDQGDEMHFIRFFQGESNIAASGQSYRQFEFADDTIWTDIRQLPQYKTGITQ